MSSDVDEDIAIYSGSEEEFDWEEVEVPAHQHLEITLDAAKASSGSKSNKQNGISHAERLTRIDCHKIHTIALISNARIRNKWLNDPLLHARLISLTPLHLQNSFGSIHKSRVPDQNQRGRMFERALEQLTTWWAHDFFEVIPEGHIRSHTYEEIQRKIEALGLLQTEEPLDLATLEDIVDDDAETIRTANSLMKHALMQSGSRDTSAQLFTALCRGLGIPARLVVSIQSVPWQAGLNRPKAKYQKPKLKGKEFLDTDTNDPSEGDLDDLPPANKAKGKQKARSVVKLRQTKDKRGVLPAPLEPVSPDPLTSPPVFWTEVFSRPDSKWFPIDSVRGIVNKRKVFDPTVNPPPGHTTTRFKVENRMLYVLAFEEDGYARDVTRRYAKQYGARIAKIQGGSNAQNVGGGGKGRQAWWERVVNVLHRPFRLHRDDLEDQELDAAQIMEGMPTTMSGFKDHPLYVLERHLKQTETLYPPPPGIPELGKFRGEPVYSRSAVVSLKAAENWLRSTGRRIKQGEQPMKMVKIRAGTINKIRELEVLKDDLKASGGPSSGEGSSTPANGDAMQGLYAFSQTEVYVADPVIDGVVPKNNFGNINLYVPSMIPLGGVHIPYKGVAKLAKKLGFDYAEAVTGFEFRKRRAFPIVEGVVVAAENEEVLLEAYWESEKDANEKAKAKKQERVLKQWTRLVHGLRIRQRLQEQYGSKASENKGLDVANEIEDNQEHDNTWDDTAAGGFLAGADRVVTSFHLPKTTHVALPSPKLRTDSVTKASRSIGNGESDIREAPELRTYDLDDGMDVEMAILGPAVDGEDKDFIPKTMQQMAEDVAKKGEEHKQGGVESGPKKNGTMSQGASEPGGKVTRTRSGAIKRQNISKASPEALGKTSRGGRSTSRRTKKRSRTTTDASDSEESIEMLGTDFADDDADEANHIQDEGEDDDDDDDEYMASPSKNKRARLGRTGKNHTTRAKATSTPSAAVAPNLLSPTMNASPSTRTLRSSRIQKSPRTG